MKSTKKLNKKSKILTGIQEGIAEVKEQRLKGKSLQKLSHFLSKTPSI